MSAKSGILHRHSVSNVRYYVHRHSVSLTATTRSQLCFNLKLRISLDQDSAGMDLSNLATEHLRVIETVGKQFLHFNKSPMNEQEHYFLNLQ